MQIKGIVVFAKFERADTFNWTDEKGNPKPIRSLKVLLHHGDETVSRESISIPEGMQFPQLTAGEVYGFPAMITLNKKRMLLNYTLRSDMEPFPAPQIA